MPRWHYTARDADVLIPVPKGECLGQGAEKDCEDAVYVVVVRLVCDQLVLRTKDLAFRAKDVPPQRRVAT